MDFAIPADHKVKIKENEKKKKTQKNKYLDLCVTYWPPTQPSIGKQVHPVEDIKI